MTTAAATPVAPPAEVVKAPMSEEAVKVAGIYQQLVEGKGCCQCQLPTITCSTV